MMSFYKFMKEARGGMSLLELSKRTNITPPQSVRH